MKPRKPKAAEPSARDKLGADFTKRLEEKWRQQGDEVLEAAFKESPTKIAELIARLVSTTEPKSDNGFGSANSMEELGIRLLVSVGLNPDAATPEMIEAAVAAQEDFKSQLEAIRDAAQGAMQ